MREALRTSREAEAAQSELKQQLEQQGDAVAAAQAAAAAAGLAALQEHERVMKEVGAELEASKQERGGWQLRSNTALVALLSHLSMKGRD